MPNRAAISIESDDPRLERSLEKLVRLTKEAGGWIDSSVTLHAVEGNIAIRTSLPADSNEVIIAIPETALIPLANVQLDLDGDVISIRSMDRGASQEARRLFEAMIEIYNLTGKMKWMRTASPWLACRGDPDLLQRLTAGRVSAGFVGHRNRLYSSGAFDRLNVDTFIGTRRLRFAKSERQQSAYSTLVPVVDYLNHHPSGARQQFHSAMIPGAQWAALNCKPKQGSDECYMFYGWYDAYDTFLTFYYVETGAPFIRSIPLVLDHESAGRIVVKSALGAAHVSEQVPQLADLGPFVPRISVPQDGTIEVSNLMIPPPSASSVLLRILEHVLKTANPKLDAREAASLAQGLATAVASKNLDFYEDLEKYLQTKAATGQTGWLLEQARLMAATQLAKLRMYQGGRVSAPSVAAGQ